MIGKKLLLNLHDAYRCNDDSKANNEPFTKGGSVLLDEFHPEKPLNFLNRFDYFFQFAVV